MGRGENLLYGEQLLAKRDKKALYVWKKRFPHSRPRQLVAVDQGLFFLNITDDLFYLEEGKERLLFTSDDQIVSPYLSDSSLSWVGKEGSIFHLPLYPDLALPRQEINTDDLPGWISDLYQAGDKIYAMTQGERTQLFYRSLEDGQWQDFQALRGGQGEEVLGIDSDAGMVIVAVDERHHRPALIDPSGQILRCPDKIYADYMFSPRIVRQDSKIFYLTDQGLVSLDFMSGQKEELGRFPGSDLQHDFLLYQDKLITLESEGVLFDNALLRVYGLSDMKILQETEVGSWNKMAFVGTVGQEEKLCLFAAGESEDYGTLLLTDI